MEKGAEMPDHIEQAEEKAKCSFTPFILMLALGVHSMFEGIALGILTQVSGAVNLIISVLIHKFAESMSISIALNKSFSNTRTIFWLMFMYAFVTPLGTAIGMIIADTSSAIVQIVFMGIATGTFFYVSCSELIVEEFSLPGNRWFKMLAFLLGAVLIGLLLLLDDD